MSAPAGLMGSDGVPVAVTTREGVVESVHHGIVAVVGHDGERLLERGNTTQPVYPRSTLKPFQALAVLSTGVELTDLETALTTASHCGSPRHRDAVASFLERFGFAEADLHCPTDWPLGAQERADMQRDVGHGDRVAMNCSGKHAGFLAACRHKDWNPSTYLDPDHPLQTIIRDEITTWTGEDIAFSSVDGCGAPLHQVSTLGLARGIARLTGSNDPLAIELLTAVANNPWALDGDGRANTVTIERLGGIAKIGAEGLIVIGIPGGIAVAVKILDGSMRATTPVALHALATVGVISEEDARALAVLTAEPVRGGERVIGGLEVRL